MQNSADAVSKATTDLNNAKAGVAGNGSRDPQADGTAVPVQSAWTQAGESLTAISKNV
jgi:hypothetical protein